MNTDYTTSGTSGTTGDSYRILEEELRFISRANLIDERQNIQSKLIDQHKKRIEESRRKAKQSSAGSMIRIKVDRTLERHRNAFWILTVTYILYALILNYLIFM